MPLYQLLTDRTLAQSSAITPTTLIHIVYTGDPSQNIAGSSYKAELGQLAGLFSGGSVSGDYLPLSGGTVSGSTNFTNGLTANTVSATTYLNLPQFSGGSGNCITDLYTSNIHSCSPLNINPLDEGNVYFGSTSGVTIDVTNSRVGIGTDSPNYPLQILGGTDTFYYDPFSSVGGVITISGDSNAPRVNVQTYNSPTSNIVLGIRSITDTANSIYGKTGDTFLYASQSVNGINIANSNGTGTEDYIRFYAGKSAISTNTPDIHIQGSGSTKGYIGIGTPTPSEKLDVSGKTKTTNFQMTSGATNGYVLTSDASGNASWQTPTGGGGTFTGGTVSGATNFTNGLTANTMSASTLFVNGVQITGDTFVTGGTFLIDTLTFTNNQNNTFQVIGITASGTTFTGGSGNCIADLYVTNVHGCSPITIYDSIRSTGTTVSGLTSFSFGFETSATTDYSFAVGAQTIASGPASHAEGFQTTASGNFSHSEGYLTYTTNNGSHAEGFQTSAVTSYSHSEGTNTYALGSGSHAEGVGSISSGSTSHAEGSGTTSVGISSHAEGFGAISIGNYSHAEGSFTRATNTGAHAEGSGTTASGIHSHAEGISTSATTQGSHAEGLLTLASDDGAHSEGYLTIASEVAAHAEGSGTTASAFYSHSEGVGTIASGDGSHSEGLGTIASGTYSHAEGRETIAIGSGSHAAGRSTISNGEYQSVIGQWNISAGTQSAFIIGNGTSDLNRSNLLFAVNSGVTVYGNFTATTISATTYLNLPVPPFFNPGTASTINWNVSGVSNNYTATLTAATTTLNVSNIRNGEYATIILTQDSSGSRDITLGTINGTSGSGRHKVSSGGGGLIYLTSNPNAVDILSCVYDGNILYWTVGNDYN